MKKTRILFLAMLFFALSSQLFAQVVVSGADAASNGNYGTLALAFTAINAQNQATNNIKVEITADITDNNTATLNAGTWTSLKVYPIGAYTLSGDIAAPLINLNGATNVTIDGRINATGSDISLTINNSNESATVGTSTIQFVNGASFNSIQYCAIKGTAIDATSAILSFSTTTSTIGNSNNTITNNNLSTSTSLIKPVNVVYSAGSAVAVNAENVISNNNVYDFFNLRAKSYGIRLAENNSAWTISGNSFYETVTLYPKSSDPYYRVISIESGTGHSIIGNYFGGKEPLCAGEPWSKSGWNTAIIAIDLAVGTGIATSVQGNIIANFNWTAGGSDSFTGINVTTGDVNIGNVTGNTMGSTIGNSSITFKSVAPGYYYPTVSGVNVVSPGIISCQNNNIGSITMSSGNSTGPVNFSGIIFNSTTTPGNIIVSNNTIGSATTANSIQNTATAKDYTQSVIGILIKNASTATVDNNLVANLNNESTRSGAATSGIRCEVGTFTSSNNVIHDLKGNSGYNSSPTHAVYGYCVFHNVSATLTGNSIYNISNTNSAFNGYVSGIYIPAVASTVGTSSYSHNFIYNISAPTAPAAILSGIIINGGANTFSNNIISIGDNNANTVYGFSEGKTITGTNTNDFYFNTVYVGGTPTTGTYRSACLNFSASTAARILKNNIFSNARTGGSGTHYSLFTYATNLTKDYNCYWGGTMSIAIAGAEVNIDPVFALAGGTAATDYRPNQTVSASLVGVSGTGITVDFASATRTYPTMGAWELSTATSLNGISNSGLKVYPNPASSTINISAENATDAVIYNFAGKAVKNVLLNNGVSNSTDISTLTSGAYLIKVHSENKTSSAIIIKK